MSTDFATMMSQSRLPERRVPICMRADLAAEHQAAERRLALAVRQNNSLEGGDTAERAAEVEALEEQMRGSTYEFRLRSMPSRRFRRLKDAHPPRRTDAGDIDERDVLNGHLFNIDTLTEVLIKASVYDPELSDEQWRELLGDSDDERDRREAAGEPVEEGKLTDAQIEALATAALELNVGDVDIPFSRVASALRRSTAAG